MKKMLFVHDIRLKCDKKNNYYANGTISDEVLNRYFKYADKITIFSRKENTQNLDEQKYDLLNRENLSFVSIDKLTPSIFFGEDYHKLRKEISNNDYIIVRMPSFLGIPAIIEANKQGKRCLVEMVACPFESLWYHGKFIFKLFAFPTMLINKMLIKKSKYVTYVTNHFLQNRYPCKNNSYSISDVDIFCDNNILTKRIEKIRKFDISNTIKIGTVASSFNVRYKGQQYVIKAISRLKRKGYKFKYLLVGTGNNKYLLNLAKKYKVQDSIVFLGALQHDQIIDYMQNLDIYIQPSNTEGIARVVLEAMSTGCPVVVSSAGGNCELIEKKYIFKKKNVKDLAIKLEDILKDDLKKISNKNFAFAQNFSKF